MRTLRALPLFLLLGLLGGCSLAEQVAVDPPPEDYVAVEDGFRYEKSCLSAQEQYTYDQVLEGLQSHALRIEGLYADTDMIDRVVRAIDRDYPELFWFSGTGQIEVTYLRDVSIKADYVPEYTMDEGLQAEVQAMVDQWEKDCVAGIPGGASDYEKAIHVYEYLIDHADYKTVEENSIVNIMVYGEGLCGCYAKTAQYMLGRLGIPCAYISGQADGVSHAWNLVWLDGVPCWMDPTWGDPVFEGGNSGDGPAYEFFGLTSEELMRTHTPDDTVPLPDCTSRDYNYFIRNELYLEGYQSDQVAAAVERCLQSGKNRVCLQFDADGYRQAIQGLFSQGDIYKVFRIAGDITGVPLNLSQSIRYSVNDTMYTMSIKIPY
ncbi:MAG: hypothetical protein HUJ67_02350 [Ruminiclostridium sp.]|nr:hypothetical protein [Ruminiclostridium sp.]